MNSYNLSAFHGNQIEKQYYLNEVHEWLQNKMVASSLHRVLPFDPSDSVLEDYESYPDKLGLPLWLSNLLCTIHRLNSRHFDFKSEKQYETYFYEQFLSACNVGVDYTQMFHRWEIFLLSELVPESQRNNKSIKTVINLHEKELSGMEYDMNEWLIESEELEIIMNNIVKSNEEPENIVFREKATQESLKAIKGTAGQKYHANNNDLMHLMAVQEAYGKISWDSYRVAFLSIQEAIDVNDVWTSSAEALVNAIWQNALIEGLASINDEKEFKSKTWYEIMDKLLNMLKEWK